MHSLSDWRDAPADVIAGLYDAECARWHGALGWDYRPSCNLIESARVSGRLRGLLAHDRRGRVLGWTYFLLHRDTLQIGNLVGEDQDVVAALLAAVVSDREAKSARRFSSFLFPSTAATERALVDLGFSILRHAYLRRTLPAPQPSGAGRDSSPPAREPCVPRDWSTRTIPDLVSLLRAAYEGTREARCFAPDGGMEQWTTYVHQLVHTPACGRFDRRLSLLVETPDGTLAGAILVTALGDRTAHVAQMAVTAEHRGRGLGTWLVDAACERARAVCFEQMTLLVAESNGRARALYDRVGFEPAAEFVFADREAGRP